MSLEDLLVNYNIPIELSHSWKYLHIPDRLQLDLLFWWFSTNVSYHGIHHHQTHHHLGVNMFGSLFSGPAFMAFRKSKYMGVSKNSGTPKSSILIGFSIINHSFWGTPIFGNTYMAIWRIWASFLPIFLWGWWKYLSNLHVVEPSFQNAANLPSIRGGNIGTEAGVR